MAFEAPKTNYNFEFRPLGRNFVPLEQTISEDSMQHLPTAYQQYIALSRYARWDPTAGRRETWPETVKRYRDFLSNHLEKAFPHVPKKEISDVFKDIEQAILTLDVMPSMRALMTAGPALERDQVAGFNCSFIAIDHVRAFDEIMYILMCGTGVGFSVERQFIKDLPIVAEDFYPTDTVIQVADSRIGWSTGLREVLAMLYAGRIPSWDLTKIRPAGALLKTFGGRASGPEPLHQLFKFCVATFKRAAGRRLTSVEVHDLVCKIADIVVVGGVRRSALISLSNLSDDRMRHAKNGQWWIENPQRALANNSTAYTEKPDFEVFLKEWITIYESRSGERGIFNRSAAEKKARENGRRDVEGQALGTNPCGEILLRSMGLCNLSEVVIRPSDTLDDLKRKVRLAAIIGTFQSTLTKFRYIRGMWQKNAEAERLLGVSFTGIFDHPVMRGDQGEETLKQWLSELKQTAIDTNQTLASALGIEPSAAITCVKPSGTVSQLVASSSGIHPAYSPYYIRTVRADIKDPLAQYLKDAGVPCEPDVTKPEAVLVFSFPMRSAAGAKTRDAVGALDQLRLYSAYRRWWCEHNPSITVYYTDNEFLAVGQWVVENWDDVCGISFLPHSDHIYAQAPYQEITEAEYEARIAALPALNWDKLSEYEHDGGAVKAQHELACSAGVCEIV